MSKAEIFNYKCDCTGILDLNDRGDYVILVDEEEEFDFVNVLQQVCGEQSH